MPRENCMRRIAAPDTISLDEIRVLANARFADMIKGVDDPATRAAIAAFIEQVVRR